MMIVEMTAYYRAKGLTLSDALEQLYATYGNYREGMIDVYMEGLDGISRRRRVMESLRDTPPRVLGNISVSRIADYLTGIECSLSGGDETPINLPKSDVLTFILVSGDRVIVRPSGTEPKIKIYLLASASSASEAEARLAAISADAKRLTELPD